MPRISRITRITRIIRITRITRIMHQENGRHVKIRTVQIRGLIILRGSCVCSYKGARCIRVMKHARTHTHCAVTYSLAICSRSASRVGHTRDEMERETHTHTRTTTARAIDDTHIEHDTMCFNILVFMKTREEIERNAHTRTTPARVIDDTHTHTEHAHREEGKRGVCQAATGPT